MPEKTRDILRGRGEAIDSAVEAAEGTNKERDGKQSLASRLSKNPYKPGSALSKLWIRRETDRFNEGK